jgi:hypothetical protein
MMPRMRRALRWIFNGAAAGSLALCVTIAWLSSRGWEGYKPGTVISFVDGKITIDRVSNRIRGKP